MSRCVERILLAVCLLLPLTVPAADVEVEARVMVSIESDREFWTGQQITLNLDLKTTGFSFSNTHFNLPEVDGAFLMQTDTTTIKLTEKVDNRSWQVVRYLLALYPQRAGLLEIPPINVRFKTSAGFGTAQTAFEFDTEPTQLNVFLPPGVKQGDLVVTTSAFTLEHDWQPASGASKTGDAVTLTVSRKAGDISAMLLPPLPVFQADGLAAYPQPPAVKDRTDRGDLTGERTDAVTWVIEKPGNYEIPGIRFQWWDPDSRELKQQVVPGLSLDIESATRDGRVPAASGEPETHFRQVNKSWITVIGGLLVAVLWLLLRRNKIWKTPDDEAAAFAGLVRACKDNHAAKTYSALHAWIGLFPGAIRQRPKPVTLDEFARGCGDLQFTEHLQDLQEALVTSPADWRGHELLQSLQGLRRRTNRQKAIRSRNSLAPLNP